MIWMRVVKTEQLRPPVARLPFGIAIILRPHTETAPGALLRRVRERVGAERDAIAADQCAAAFVGIGVRPVAPDRVCNARLKDEWHYRVPFAAR